MCRIPSSFPTDTIAVSSAPRSLGHSIEARPADPPSRRRGGALGGRWQVGLAPHSEEDEPIHPGCRTGPHCARTSASRASLVLKHAARVGQDGGSEHRHRGVRSPGKKAPSARTAGLSGRGVSSLTTSGHWKTRNLPPSFCSTHWTTMVLNSRLDASRAQGNKDGTSASVTLWV